MRASERQKYSLSNNPVAIKDRNMEKLASSIPPKSNSVPARSDAIGQHLAERYRKCCSATATERIKQDGLFERVQPESFRQGIAWIECGGIDGNHFFRR